MSNDVLPERSTIVISFVGSEGLEKWIGSWKDFKLSHPKARVKNVKTFSDYKKRLKPLNEIANEEKEEEELKELQRKYQPQSTPTTADNH